VAVYFYITNVKLTTMQFDIYFSYSLDNFNVVAISDEAQSIWDQTQLHYACSEQAFRLYFKRDTGCDISDIVFNVTPLTKDNYVTVHAELLDDDELAQLKEALLQRLTAHNDAIHVAQRTEKEYSHSAHYTTYWSVNVKQRWWTDTNHIIAHLKSIDTAWVKNTFTEEALEFIEERLTDEAAQDLAYNFVNYEGEVFYEEMCTGLDKDHPMYEPYVGAVDKKVVGFYGRSGGWFCFAKDFTDGLDEFSTGYFTHIKGNVDDYDDYIEALAAAQADLKDDRTCEVIRNVKDSELIAKWVKQMSDGMEKSFYGTLPDIMQDWLERNAYKPYEERVLEELNMTPLY